MHTHLKGRIFNTAGTTYLVLTDRCKQPDYLRVKALNAGRTIYDMRSEDVERHLSHEKVESGGSTRASGR